MLRAVANDPSSPSLREPPFRETDLDRLAPLIRDDFTIATEGDNAARNTRRCVGRGVSAVHGAGAVLGSFAIHGGAAVAAAIYFSFVVVHPTWVLSQRQGRDSVALVASMAAPPPKTEEPITIVPPESTPPTPNTKEPEPLDAEPMETFAKQAVAVVERPSAAFADIKEEPRQPPAPISETRAEIESPEAGEAVSAVQPKRKPRATNAAMPRDSTATTTLESVAAAASAADSGVVTDQPPPLVDEVRPIYPPESKVARETGIVKLRVKVDSRGNVVEASIYRSSGYRRLDQAALDVIYSNRFAPADGSPSGRASEFVHPITFRLTEIPARR